MRAFRKTEGLLRKLKSAGGVDGSAPSKVVEFLEQNRALALVLSAAEIGARVGASDATVIRTVQSLGFSGIKAFKLALLDSMQEEQAPAVLGMHNTLLEIQQSGLGALFQVFEAHSDALRVLTSEACQESLLSALKVLDAADRIVLFGIGPTASLANYMALLLIRNGRSSFVLDRTGSALADQLLQVRGDDAVLLLSYGEPYSEALAALNVAKLRGAPSVLMTDQTSGLLVADAGVTIHLPRGRSGRVALHGATLVALEGLVVGLAAKHPKRTLEALNDLDKFREDVTARRAHGARSRRKR